MRVFGGDVPKAQPCPGPGVQAQPGEREWGWHRAPAAKPWTRLSPDHPPGTRNSISMEIHLEIPFHPHQSQIRHRAGQRHRHCSPGAYPVCPLQGLTGSTGETHTGLTETAHSPREPSRLAISLTAADLTSPQLHSRARIPLHLP